jgi:antirestriction protein ArdC
MQQATIYEQVTTKIIACLERGVAPWRKPWSTHGLPRNYNSGHVYQGINSLLLNFAEYEYPLYLSFHQIKERGGYVSKGAKAEQVYFFSMLYWDEKGQKLEPEAAKILMEAGHPVMTKRFLQYFNVFNIAHVEGIALDLPEAVEMDTILTCKSILASLPEQPRLMHKDKERAFYSPVLDKINMPYQRQFENPEAYYSTFFHELIHWTGHNSRLDRLVPSRFGDDPYSKEELVAEIGAAFLCAHAGIDFTPTIEQSAAYLKGWIEALKGDHTLIFHAAGAAQKAVQFLIMPSQQTA